MAMHPTGPQTFGSRFGREVVPLPQKEKTCYVSWTCYHRKTTSALD